MWVLLGTVIYIVLGLLTSVRCLINRGREIATFWEGKPIKEENFDEDDRLFALALIIIWPIMWIFFAAVKLVTFLECYIVIPVVNGEGGKEKK